MAVNLLPENFGSLVDFYQGKQDLEKGAIRILHDLSFVDDPTRIIRAVRFEQRLKFRIEPRTLRLLKQAVKRGMLKRVSPHRLRDEIILILKEPAVLKCILRLEKLVGFNFIHQKLKLGKGNLKFLTAVKSQIDWFNRNFPKHKNLDIWLMYFIGLLSSLNSAQINQVSKRFGLRRQEIKIIESYHRFSSKQILLLGKKNIQLSQVYRILQALSPEAILLLRAKYTNKFLAQRIKLFFHKCMGIRIYIRGEDLTKLGLKPSPRYKRILNRLLYLQLDGQINSRAEALQWIKQWLLPS
jgi:tRNA nucleotidyltransferase (CCA-adding enzyme)